MDALRLAEKYVTDTNVSVFLTGKAGTGKTTFLHQIASTVNKRCVVLAPTGVAAVNAAGVTIHSFFQLPLCPYLPDVKELVTEYQMPDKYKSLRKEKINIIRTLDLIIIDEISMVRADLLDAVDMTLRHYRRSGKPFGGVQLLMIGDVQQLPPVVKDDERPYIEQVYPSPFFFNSKALKQIHYVTIELTHIFRQQDNNFIGLLNNIRENRFDKATLDALNARCNPGFNPPDTEGYIRLTTHNYQANEVNHRKLAALDSEPVTLRADVDGNFPETSFPTDNELVLKKGAQVMFVKNDTSGKGEFFNGKIATVEGYDADVGVAVVDSEGNHIVVHRERWDNIKYEIDAADNQIKQKVDGTFVQFPLRLAWAITIHKSQGLTFDKVIIDAASAFTYGQVYVALSRCRTLEGLVLATPISSRCVFDNSDVLQFNSTIPSVDKVQAELGSFQSSYFFEQLYELFDISSIFHAAERLNRIYQQHLSRMLPALSQKINDLTNNNLVNLLTVSEKFHKQLANISLMNGGNTNDAALLDRVAKGVAYYEAQLEDYRLQMVPLMEIEVNNKSVAAELKEWSTELRDAVDLKLRCLKRVGENGFSTEVYNQAKVDFLLDKNPGAKGKRAARRSQTSRRAPKEKPVKERKAASSAPIASVEPFAEESIYGFPKEPETRVQREPKVKVKEPKEKKPPTWMESLQLFSQGMSIEQIAAQRGFTFDTIANHLQKALEAGALGIDKLLTSEEFDELVEYMLEGEGHPFKEIYEHFGGRYPYYKIRAAATASKDIRDI